MVRDSHSPSRRTYRETQRGLHRIPPGRLIEPEHRMVARWASQIDHAAKNETPLVLAHYP